MNSSRFSIGGRVTALLALSVLVVVGLGSTIGFAADPDADGERCVGCPGCENGECAGENEDPFESHHHCCATSCMSHVSVAMPAAPTTLAPVIAEEMSAGFLFAVIARSADSPYRPPRV